MNATRLAALLGLVLAAPLVGRGLADAQGVRGLAGAWTITTVPAISRQGGRGQPTTPRPIALVLTSGKTPLAGTMRLWKGDYEASDAVTGSVDGAKVVLRTANYTFTGTHDPATNKVTGTVVETPSGALPGGTKTTFTMAR